MNTTDPQAPRKRILVVDDDPSIVTAVCTRLAGAGHFPVPAGTGAQGLDAFDFGGIDAIITDLNMPMLNGVDMIQRLRQRGVNVPIIVVTGYRTIAPSVLRELGDTRILRKPFDFKNLLMLLDDDDDIVPVAA